MFVSKKLFWNFCSIALLLFATNAWSHLATPVVNLPTGDFFGWLLGGDKKPSAPVYRRLDRGTALEFFDLDQAPLQPQVLACLDYLEGLESTGPRQDSFSRVNGKPPEDPYLIEDVQRILNLDRVRERFAKPGVVPSTEMLNKIFPGGQVLTVRQMFAESKMLHVARLVLNGTNQGIAGTIVPYPPAGLGHWIIGINAKTFSLTTTWQNQLEVPLEYERGRCITMLHEIQHLEQMLLAFLDGTAVFVAQGPKENPWQSFELDYSTDLLNRWERQANSFEDRFAAFYRWERNQAQTPFIHVTVKLREELAIAGKFDKDYFALCSYNGCSDPNANAILNRLCNEQPAIERQNADKVLLFATLDRLSETDSRVADLRDALEFHYGTKLRIVISNPKNATYEAGNLFTIQAAKSDEANGIFYFNSEVFAALEPPEIEAGVRLAASQWQALKPK